jgi:hypothetical protein
MTHVEQQDRREQQPGEDQKEPLLESQERKGYGGDTNERE